MAEAKRQSQADPVDDAPYADEKRMPFSEHLQELRARLRNAVLGVFAATVVAFLFRKPLFALMARPLINAWAEVPRTPGMPSPEVVFTSPLEPFMVLLKLSIVAGIFLASPLIFHQLWKFISPGLYAHERRVALPFIVSSVLLFVGGAAFAYVFVLPKGFEYFLGYSNPSMGIITDVLGKQEVWGHKIDIRLTEAFAVKPMITMAEYFDLTSMLLLVFGAVFELPLILGVLALLGVVTPGGLWRFNRYFILIAFVGGAILTPGDLVVGQMAMGAALTVLYNLSILFAVVTARRKTKRVHREREDAACREDANRR